MRGYEVVVVLLVALATCSANVNDTRPENVISRLRESGRLEAMLTAADSNNNQRFTASELSDLLFRNGDVDTPANGRVTWSEFMDYWAAQAPSIPPPVRVKMFYLLDSLNADGGRTAPATCNDPANVFSNVVDVGDGELQAADLTNIQSLGAANDSIAAVREAVEMWIREAARRVFMASTSAFKIAEEYSVEFDYDRFFTDVDVNNDGVISQGELEGLLTLLGASPATSASRQQWFTATTERYKQSPYSALVFFDNIDSDNNNKLDASDMLQLYKRADANMDERVTKQELYRFMQHQDKLIRRMLGLPIKPFMYDCPQVYWDDECGDPTIEATLATMDADYNFDGKITKEELDMVFWFFDNMDGKVNRANYLEFRKKRYGQSMAEADIEFDAIDDNGDGYYSSEDMEEADEVCACEFRMHVLVSARAAANLAEKRKKEADWLRMKFSMLMAEASEKAKRREAMSMDPWYWMTMNGGPAKGGCKTCTARQNWGKAEMGKEGEMEGDWDVVTMLLEAVQGLKMEQDMMAGQNKSKLVGWLADKMKMLKQEVEEKIKSMDDDMKGGDDMKWEPEDKGWKPWGDKPWGDKPWGDKPWGAKPWGQGWKPWGETPWSQGDIKDGKEGEMKWGQDWKAWNDRPWMGMDGRGQAWGPWRKMGWQPWQPADKPQQEEEKKGGGEEKEQDMEKEPTFADFMEWMKQKYGKDM